MTYHERLITLTEIAFDLHGELASLKPSDTIDTRYDIWRRLLLNIDRQYEIAYAMLPEKDRRLYRLGKSMPLIRLQRQDYTRKAAIMRDGLYLLDLKLDCLNLVLKKIEK